MIKTEADLAKLTARQREVLVGLVRNLSMEKVSQIAKATTNIDAAALLQVYTIVQEALSRLESSTSPSISPALASLAEEWQALTPDGKAKRHVPGKSTNHTG